MGPLVATDSKLSLKQFHLLIHHRQLHFWMHSKEVTANLPLLKKKDDSG
jgi:hypothetical protein